MVFCNLLDSNDYLKGKKSHNPYFNRWFSAIENQRCNWQNESSHNPYFNRWFSAIASKED